MCIELRTTRAECCLDGCWAGRKSEGRLILGGMLDRERAHVIDSQLGPYDAISGHMRCGYRRTTAIGIAKCVRRFEASFNGS